MEKVKVNKKNNRVTFASITPVIDTPDLLNIQLESFEEFLQLKVPPEKRENKGLQGSLIRISRFWIIKNFTDSILSVII